MVARGGADVNSDRPEVIRALHQANAVSYSDRMDIRVEPRLREAIQASAANHGIKVADSSATAMDRVAAPRCRQPL